MEVDVSGTVVNDGTWTRLSAQLCEPEETIPAVCSPSADRLVSYQRLHVQQADDSLIVSSRENFLICLDYGTSAIKWILGDTTQKMVPISVSEEICAHACAGSLPPIGQHSPSITYDQNLLVFDIGFESVFQILEGSIATMPVPASILWIWLDVLRLKCGITLRTRTSLPALLKHL
jgi:hypothetical protein